MGISGLHQALRPYLQPVHCSAYRGQRVGCDGYAWLHRGACGCAAELAAGEAPWAARGFPPPYVDFCLRMVSMLRAAGVVPVVVLDGGSLPAKAATNAERRARRREAAERGAALLAAGRAAEAGTLLTQSVAVTPAMVQELIAHLRWAGCTRVGASVCP